QTMLDLLGREFADATAEGLREAKAATKASAAAERTLARTAKELSALAARWDRERAAGDELAALLDEVGRLEAEAEGAARERTEQLLVCVQLLFQCRQPQPHLNQFRLGS